MTKERLAKIAASIAIAPFYAVAWCAGILVRALLAILTAIVIGFSNALSITEWGKVDATD